MKKTFKKSKSVNINLRKLLDLNTDLLEIREREHAKSIDNRRMQLPNPEYGKKKKIHLISLSMKFRYEEGRGRTII